MTDTQTSERRMMKTPKVGNGRGFSGGSAGDDNKTAEREQCSITRTSSDPNGMRRMRSKLRHSTSAADGQLNKLDVASAAERAAVATDKLVVRTKMGLRLVAPAVAIPHAAILRGRIQESGYVLALGRQITAGRTIYNLLVLVDGQTVFKRLIGRRVHR